MLSAHTLEDGSQSTSIWYVDPSATKHMTGQKKWFLTFRPHHGTITLGDDTTHEIKGIGDISLLFGIHKWRVTNVLYVPGFTKNLLFITQFHDHNLRIEFDSTKDKKFSLIIDKSKNDKVFASATKVGRMFRLDTIVHDQALVTKNNDLSMLWHRRYGHLSTSYLLKLCKNTMVKWLPSLDKSDTVCSSCLAGKQHRASFYPSKHLASQPL